MSWQETLVGGGLVLIDGIAGTYLAHHFQLTRDRESREQERQERREDRRMDELLAIQDDVTELQETYALVAAKKKAGSPTDPDLYIRSGRTRQRIWKRAARIDSEEAWDLAGKLIDATGEVYGATTVHEIDSAMTVIANTGAEIQRLVGKLLGGTAKQLDRGVELPD